MSLRILAKLVLAVAFSTVGIWTLPDCYSAPIPITKTPLYKHLIKTSEKSAGRRDPARGGAEPNMQQEKPPEKAEALTNEVHIRQDCRTNELTNKPVHKQEEEFSERKVEGQTFQNKNAGLSALHPDMAFSEAIDVFRNSTDPPLNIIMLWRDIEANSDVDRYTTIGMEPVPGVSIGKNLELVLMAVSSNPKSLGYVVDNGTIIVGTRDSIRLKSETRVYNVTDLLGQPANYFIPLAPMPYYGMPYGGGYGGNNYGGGTMPYGGYGYGGQGAYGSPYITGGYGTNVGSIRTGTGISTNPYTRYDRGRDLADLIQAHTSGTRR